MSSEIETKSILAKLYWDSKVDPEQLYELLNGDRDKIGHIDITNLYYRMLMTLDWHTILRVVPEKKLGELLSDSVLNRIRFKDLKEKFIYELVFNRCL